ncbi:MAG: type VII toxin-antitoxin system MntA family adenylyltransferase antitoxin [Myxococcaceae bacterium]
MQDLSESIKHVRSALPDVQAVYLFGSQASGTSTERSDFDIAVLAPHPIHEALRWELSSRLAETLGAEVDLVDLRAASTVMRVQILAKDRILLDAAPAERAFFEATTLSDYARLNVERREILEDIRRRGSVYG